MVNAVLVIGTANLLMGFAAAVLWKQPAEIVLPAIPGRLPGIWRGRRRSLHGKASAHGEAPGNHSAAHTAADDKRAVELPPMPAEWSELLQSRGIPYRSFSEAFLWNVRLSLATLQEEICHLEQSLREPTANLPEDAVPTLVTRLDHWRSTWNTTLAALKPPPGDQAVLAEFVGCLASATTPPTNAESGSDSSPLQPVNTLQREFDRLTELREWCDERLIPRIRAADLIELLTAEDAPLGAVAAPSRLETERQCEQWIAMDPERVRIISIALLDLDGCRQHNHHLGLAVTDGILRGVKELLSGVVRKERGFDRVSRWGGQTYLVFLGDTALRNAVTATERFRQNLAAAKFLVAGTPLQVTGSFAVGEWGPGENLDAVVQRLRESLVLAKQNRGNCTVVCGGDEPRLATPALMQVPSREIVIGETRQKAEG